MFYVYSDERVCVCMQLLWRVWLICSLMLCTNGQLFCCCVRRCSLSTCSQWGHVQSATEAGQYEADARAHTHYAMLFPLSVPVLMLLLLVSPITWPLQIRTAPEPPPLQANDQWEDEKPPHIPPRPDATRKVRKLIICMKHTSCKEAVCVTAEDHVSVSIHHFETNICM